MIRVLMVVSIMDTGGMENYIMNIYRNIDRTRMQFDFLVHHSKEGFFDKEIEKMGGRIFKLPVLDNWNLLQYLKDLNELFVANPEIKIIHGHLSSLAVFYLWVAKHNGIKWRIVHSHGAGYLKTFKGYLKYILFRSAKIFGNVYYACSQEAGKYLYGRDKFTVIPNAVDVKRFAFNKIIRENVRRELEIGGDFVIGHVGRFNLQKNHEFILQIFNGFLLKEPNAKLMLVGGGELENKIKNRAKELGIFDKIIFTGVRKDTENLYQAMDVFILPSLFEGLPVTGIEAQYSGLPCILADNISKEVVISKKVEFLAIDDHLVWINRLLYVLNNQEDRELSAIVNNDFDVNLAAYNMVERYLQMWEVRNY